MQAFGFQTTFQLGGREGWQHGQTLESKLESLMAAIIALKKVKNEPLIDYEGSPELDEDSDQKINNSD